ncbi:UNVERIFIED_CONTAM: hypothetical protein GTU68_063918 [Idotea baltica]|nr:hypothetical protein [Idotea baltica]
MSNQLTPQIIEEKTTSVKTYLQAEFGVTKIGYFGSYVKGNFTNTSDVDIFIDFNKTLGWKFFDLKEYLEKGLNKEVDLVTKRSLKKNLKANILQQIKFI